MGGRGRFPVSLRGGLRASGSFFFVRIPGAFLSRSVFVARFAFLPVGLRAGLVRRFCQLVLRHYSVAGSSRLASRLSSRYPFLAVLVACRGVLFALCVVSSFRLVWRLVLLRLVGCHGVRFCLPSRRVVSSVMPCVVSMGVSSGGSCSRFVFISSRLWCNFVVASCSFVSVGCVSSGGVSFSLLPRRGRGSFFYHHLAIRGGRAVFPSSIFPLNWNGYGRWAI